MITSIHNFFRGSLEISITGAAVERFLNLCAIHDVAFWDMRSPAPDCFTAWISVGGYFALRPYARMTGCRVRVCKKQGFPFAAKRMTRRWSLLLCAALCAGLIWYLSGFVWTVEILGCQRTTQQEILQLLQKGGLHTGTRRAAVHVRDLRNHVMNGTDKLSYLTVNFKGTQAIVEVWERAVTPEKLQEDVPCDVVSDLTGVIDRLQVRTGVTVAQKGQTLQPGDLIATGVITSAQGESRLVHAVAEATLRTWYTFRTLVPAEIGILSQTENTQIRHEFVLGNRRFHLDLIEKKPFACYDKSIRQSSLDLQENFHWPVALVEEICVQCEATPSVVDDAALSALLRQRMLNRLKNAKPDAQLVSETFSLERQNEAYLGVLRVELRETAGKEVPINEGDHP